MSVKINVKILLRVEKAASASLVRIERLVCVVLIVGALLPLLKMGWIEPEPRSYSVPPAVTVSAVLDDSR